MFYYVLDKTYHGLKNFFCTVLYIFSYLFFNGPYFVVVMLLGLRNLLSRVFRYIEDMFYKLMH